MIAPDTTRPTGFRFVRLMGAGLVAAAAWGLAAGAGNAAAGAAPKAADDGIKVDKDKKEVVLDAEIAPRKLDKVVHPDLAPDDPRRKNSYPLEVFASHAFPAQKAHETVIVVTALPSKVQKAVESLGLKPGRPGLRGQNKAEGPELKLFLEFDKDGKTVRVPAEETFLNANGNKAIAGVKWLFTGSEMIMPDPEKDDTVPGADFSKALVGIYPVTKQVIIQTNLTEENGIKLETNPAVVPAVGTKCRLVIAVAK